MTTGAAPLPARAVNDTVCELPASSGPAHSSHPVDDRRTSDIRQIVKHIIEGTRTVTGCPTAQADGVSQSPAPEFVTVTS